MKAQILVPSGLGSNPSSVTDKLCDLEQVARPL